MGFHCISIEEKVEQTMSKLDHFLSRGGLHAYSSSYTEYS